MNALSLVCACGRRYDDESWDTLMLAGYSFEGGHDRELRMCECGRMLAGRIASGRPRTPPIHSRDKKRASG